VAADPIPFRIAFVPGVTVRKWTRRWEERHPELPLEVVPASDADGVAVVHAHAADVSFVRLPVERDGLSVIRLYGEAPVVVLPRDHDLATLESVTLDRLGSLDGVVEFPPAGSVKDAVELVAAGVGSLRLPHSLARLHARKDVVAVPVSDAPETDIALVWLAAETTEQVEEFVGIVRGRTAASSRANPTPPTERPPRPQKVAKPRPKQRGRTPRRRQGR